MTSRFGKLLMVPGLGLRVPGGVTWLGGGRLLGWFGRLPDDIRIERPGFRLYAPLASMLPVSIVVSLVTWLTRRLN
ncbi:hypothetical protein GCM10022408_02450 [Hymenobacter fastidiosus]|uniref:DUF2905 domain-containing protein n=1 Tax=Hymenobacter fastidiosus TaxID=486264 RepID=A0ABP7RBX8_9BACT